MSKRSSEDDFHEFKNTSGENKDSDGGNSGGMLSVILAILIILWILKAILS